MVTVHPSDAEGDRSAPSAFREADVLARVSSGETIVFAGFRRERERRLSTGGWFRRSTVVMRKRVELMILLTPRIL